MRINVVPKDGGNTFAGTFLAYGANGPLQADNRSEAIKAFIPTPPGIDYDYQVNPSFGGPIGTRQTLVLLHLQVRRTISASWPARIFRTARRSAEVDGELQRHHTIDVAGAPRKTKSGSTWIVSSTASSTTT